MWRETLERWQGWQAWAQVRILVNGWPHEALGEELSRCLISRVADGM